MTTDQTITMSVSRRIYEQCQLDALAGHYGLTAVPSQRKGYWFNAPISAWRRLANDVDERGGGGYDPACALYRSEGLHSRINKHLCKMEVAA